MQQSSPIRRIDTRIEDAVREVLDDVAEDADGDDDQRAAQQDGEVSLADGDIARARERLAAVLPSVCEQQVPETVDVEGRPVTCHRYDPDIEAEPRPWTGG